MSSKKISRDNSYLISSSIAKKAFEHLINPLQQQLTELGAEAAKALNAQLDVAQLRKLNIIGEETENMSIWVYADESPFPQDNRKVILKGEGWVNFYWYTPRIVDADLHARASVVAERLDQLGRQRTALENELRNQCYGKTVKAALTAWPEAADIISKIVDVPMTEGFVSPLESLFAKFLPMLPAPAEAAA